MMSNVVAAPQHYIVSQRDERLHNIVFKDETVLAYTDVAPDESVRTEITDRAISPMLSKLQESRPKAVKLAVDDRNIDAVSFWWKTSPEFV
jgi:hypothetical protein